MRAEHANQSYIFSHKTIIVSAVSHVRNYGERRVLSAIGARRRLRRSPMPARQCGNTLLCYRRETPGWSSAGPDAGCAACIGASRSHLALGQLHESRDQRRR